MRQRDERTVELGPGEHGGRFRVAELDERQLGAVQRAREHRAVAGSTVMAECRPPPPGAHHDGRRRVP